MKDAGFSLIPKVVIGSIILFVIIYIVHDAQEREDCIDRGGVVVEMHGLRSGWWCTADSSP